MVGGIDLNDRAQHGPFLQTTSAHPSTTPLWQISEWAAESRSRGQAFILSKTTIPYAYFLAVSIL